MNGRLLETYSTLILNRNSKHLRVNNSEQFERDSAQNSLNKMMINFTVKSNIKSGNKNKCKVLILGQYQIFGHDDYLRKRPYSQSK